MKSRNNGLLKTVAECILDEEGSVHVIVNADVLDIPLEGAQRLVLGGKATPYLKITDEGIAAGLSINRFHYDIFIQWEAVNAVEGENMAFYCKREAAGTGGKEAETGADEKKRHLSLVTD